MKRALVVLAAFVSVSLLGCGGATAEFEPEVSTEVEADEGSTVSQFATCTALCDGAPSVSCSGTSCSATNNQGVTCDGVFTACSQQPPLDDCEFLMDCSWYWGQACGDFQSQQACCLGNTVNYCYCSGAGTTWLCP